VQSGATFTAAGFEVTAVGTRHAHVHGDVPDIPNLGYVVAPGLYHPGDAFYVPGLPIQTLLVPISAPWLKVGEAIDFVQAVAPRRAYPIHDGILNEVGQALTDRWLQQLSGTDYSRLPLGEPVDL
jgi:L-ascorbate metabolism protein UlaG (beta-lactamase superfamily)